MDQKISQLTALTTPALEDLLAIVDDPSGTPETKKIALSNLLLDENDMASNSQNQGATQQSIKAYVDNSTPDDLIPEDGWSEADALTYASTTTFTASGDLTTKYQPGDKIKLTQSTGGTKYWVLRSVSHGGGTTTFTIIETTDYTLNNEAISDPFYSKVENPQGFPTAFNYTPAAFVGFSANPSGVHRYFTKGRAITLFVAQTTAGTSNATNFEFTAPVPARTVSGMIWDSAASAVRNNSVTEIGTGGLFIGSAGTNIRAARNATSTGWTNTNQKAIIGAQITYEF